MLVLHLFSHRFSEKKTEVNYPNPPSPCLQKTIAEIRMRFYRSNSQSQSVDTFVLPRKNL